MFSLNYIQKPKTGPELGGSRVESNTGFLWTQATQWHQVHDV